MQLANKTQRTNRIFQLSEDTDGRVFHLTAEVSEKDAPRTWETLTRTGKFYHPFHGDFEITTKILREMVKNFKANVYGQKLFIDVQHSDVDGAAAEIIDVKVSGNRLQVYLEWTEEGRKQVKEKGRRYLSIEYHETYQSNEYDESTGKRPVYGAVLTGGGLVLKPHVKGMNAIDPHALAEAQGDECRHVVLHPTLQKKLHEEHNMKRRDQLLASLRSRKLSEVQISSIMANYDSQMKGKEDNIELAEAIATGIENAVKQLGEVAQDQPISLSVNVSQENADAGDVATAVAKALSERDQKDADNAVKLSELKGKYKATINESKSLSEAEKTALIAQGDELIAINLTEAQVVGMATTQLSQAEEMVAARKLSEQGFAAQSAQGSLAVNNKAVQLGERIHGVMVQNLKNTTAYSNKLLKLTESGELSPFTKQVLGQFDTLNHTKLLSEEKALSEGTLTDAAIPASVQRAVIPEVLEDLKVLELIQTVIDSQAGPTGTYYHEVRDKGPLNNYGIVPEGGSIQTSGVSTKAATLNLVARKLAMKLTQELIDFSKTSSVNWDAWARTISANATLMREELARWVQFQIQLASDSHGAMVVTDENIKPLLARQTFALAKFPIAPAHTPRDLAGNPVGAEQNPIVFNVDGTPLAPYPFGAKVIAVGNYYYVNSHNLGLISTVDKDLNPVTITGTAVTISYSYATNVEKFDTDLPADVDEGKHLNGLVRKFGKIKARMYQDVGVEPDFSLMSATLHEELTGADIFTTAGSQAGTKTNNEGDLESIKGLPAYRTNQGSILGEERIQLGVRNTTTLIMRKPFSLDTSTPVEAVDADGNFTGEKMAYGSEYSGIDTPAINRDRYKAIIAYSKSERDVLATAPI